MEIASTEQVTNYPILREQFFGADAERGSISSKLAMTVGSLVMAMAVGGALGAGEYALHHPLIKTDIAVSAGKGTLTDVSTIVPQACYGVYRDNVNGAKASYNTTIPLFGIKIPTTLSASSIFNGNITSKVCNDSMSLDLHFDKSTNKYELTVPGSAFHTDVYRTDPTVNAFTSDNGALMALMKNAENDINALPKLEAHKTDGLMGTLNGYAELAADQTSAEACGPKAWLYLEPLYKISLQKQLTAEANRWRPELKLTQDDFRVAVEGDVVFTTQYDKQLTEIKVQAAKHNVTIKLPDPSKLVCTVSPSLQKNLDQLAGVAK